MVNSGQWEKNGKKYVICIESYKNHVLQGGICTPDHGVDLFGSMTEFLLKMDALLDHEKEPQAYTRPRRFRASTQIQNVVHPVRNRRPCVATFELKVVFRQHSSWQGILVWREASQEAYFRSVLELVILLDSALRSEPKL